MNTEQIMAAVERYRTAGGREEHHAYKDQLETAITELVQERDELNDENKVLRDALEGITRIENEMYGLAGAEIEQARSIARAALQGANHE